MIIISRYGLHRFTQLFFIGRSVHYSSSWILPTSPVSSENTRHSRKRTFHLIKLCFFELRWGFYSINFSLASQWHTCFISWGKLLKFLIWESSPPFPSLWFSLWRWVLFTSLVSITHIDFCITGWFTNMFTKFTTSGQRQSAPWRFMHIGLVSLIISKLILAKIKSIAEHIFSNLMPVILSMALVNGKHQNTINESALN